MLGVAASVTLREVGVGKGTYVPIHEVQIGHGRDARTGPTRVLSSFLTWRWRGHCQEREPLGNADVFVGALDVTFSISADEDVGVPRNLEG